MDNYLAELAKSRASLIDKMMEINWSYTGRREKVETIQAEIAKIDAMIDKVIEPSAPPLKEERTVYEQGRYRHQSS